MRKPSISETNFHHYLAGLAMGALLLLLASCNLPLNTPTPSPAPPSITPTRATPTRSPSPSFTPYTPIIMCTPPLCWNDETYYCPKTCPGGCGTTCATRTPDPKASLTPTFPVIANPCRLPTANPATPSPQLAACASASRVRVGETFHFIAAVSPAQAADFRFTLRDLDGKSSLSYQVNRENRVQGYGTSTNILTLAGYRVAEGKLTLLLKAKAAGSAEINIIAVGLPGSALYSEHHTIVVVP